MNKQNPGDGTYSMEWLSPAPPLFLSRVTEVWIFLQTKGFRREARKVTPFYYQDDKKFGSVKYVTRCFPFWCVFPVHVPESGRYKDSP